MSSTLTESTSAPQATDVDLDAPITSAAEVATAAQLVARARANAPAMTPAQVQANTFLPDALLVDVREPEEIDDEGLIAGAWHVPRGLLEFWADPTDPGHRDIFDRDRMTIVYCSDGQRAALAVEVLVRLGYRNAFHLEGGINAWKAQDYPVAGLHPWHRDA